VPWARCWCSAEYCFWHDSWVRAFWLIFLPALAYQSLAIFAALNHLRRRYSNKERPRAYQPPVSVLKPLRGLDPNTFEAFLSQASQNYPEYEILFGVAETSDPAIPEVRRLQERFPNVCIRLVVGREEVANGKVGVLIHLGSCAKHAIWVVNDSDIKVTAEYLSSVVAPLENPSIGVVTCLYRARGHTPPSVWESLGVACDFMPSTLVAQLIGVREFGLGSTLAFRASDLARAGGFAAIGDYLADDYQLAKHITRLGKQALLSTYTVETALGDVTWKGGWQHQLRWARTIRACKGGGYAGLPITHGGVWILLAIVSGAAGPAFVLLVLRLCSALISSLWVLGNSQAAALFWLAPAWDLYSFAVWLTSYSGREVRWRDRVLSIDPRGKIQNG
jgi:ceramide glucosyltransferase